MFERRAVLAGLAGLPLASAPAVAISARALATTADPFITYHQRILAIQAAVNAVPGEEASDQLMGVWNAIDHEVLAGRPTTLGGALGALQMARREFVQFQLLDDECTDDPSKRLVLHLLDGAISVLRRAADGGAS